MILRTVLLAALPALIAAESIMVGAPFGWAAGQEFKKINAKVGDVLVFQFDVNHNVWSVPNEGCEFSQGKQLATNTQSPYIHSLTEPGTFFFACGTAGHCQAGQNVEVEVSMDVQPVMEEVNFNQLCLASDCNFEALQIPMDVKPGELNGLLTPVYNEHCGDAISMQCAEFINNLQACARKDRWEEGMKDTAALISPYIGTFARSWATTVRYTRNAILGVDDGFATPGSFNRPGGAPTAAPAAGAEESPLNCPTGQILAHATGPASGFVELSSSQCILFCMMEAFLQMIPGGKAGMCPAKFSEMTGTETIQPAGSPMPMQIAYYEMAAADEMMVVELPALVCAPGEIVVRAYGEAAAEYGLPAGACASFCLMEFALSFIPGAQRGPCSEAGFKQFMSEEMYQPPGGFPPMKLHVYMKEAVAGMECAAGQFVAHSVEPSTLAMYELVEGQCMELCTTEMGMMFMAGSQKGPCVSAGYDAFVFEDTVQPAGSPFPMFIRVFEGEGNGMEQPEVEVDPLKEGWCEEYPGAGTDGRDLVTCYSLAIDFLPGEVLNWNYALPNPFKSEVAVYRRGAWVVDGDLKEVSLGEMYMHHLGSSLVGGVGSEFRGWTTPFPDDRRLIMGPQVPGFANLHLINTIGVADEDILPCIECWCDRPEGNLEFTQFGDKSGVDCCYNCATTAPMELKRYHLKYSFEIEPVTENTVPLAQIWMDIIPGKIEYDVPAALPGQEPVYIVEHETLIDYSAPQAEPVVIHRCAAHLHLASLGMWMYDGITGEELCHVDTIHGTGDRYEIMNEYGYLVGIVPTSYSPPMVLEPGHPVKLVAKYNSTVYHGGVMALLWIDVEARDGFRTQGNFFTNFDVEAFAPPECPSRDPPTEVRMLHAAEIKADGTVTLMWAHPKMHFDCKKDVFSVEYAVKDNGTPRFELSPFNGFSVEAGVQGRDFFGSDTMATLKLDPSQEYYIRVTAYKRRAIDNMMAGMLPEDDTDGVGPFSEIVVSFKSDSPKPQGAPGAECVDLEAVAPWFDSYGPKYSCQWYNAKRCSQTPEKYANFGLDATEACCVCKGEDYGTCKDALVTTPWHDEGGVGYDCQYYAANPSACETLGGSRRFMGLTAKEACCACGGGGGSSDYLESRAG